MGKRVESELPMPPPVPARAKPAERNCTCREVQEDIVMHRAAGGDGVEEEVEVLTDAGEDVQGEGGAAHGVYVADGVAVGFVRDHGEDAAEDLSWGWGFSWGLNQRRASERSEETKIGGVLVTLERRESNSNERNEERGARAVVRPRVAPRSPSPPSPLSLLFSPPQS